MKKFVLSMMVVAVVAAFSTVSLQAQCSGGCSGKDKKTETTKEAPKKS